MPINSGLSRSISYSKHDTFGQTAKAFAVVAIDIRDTSFFFLGLLIILRYGYHIFIVNADGVGVMSVFCRGGGAILHDGLSGLSRLASCHWYDEGYWLSGVSKSVIFGNLGNSD